MNEGVVVFVAGIIAGIIIWNIPNFIAFFVGSHITDTFVEHYPPLGLLAEDDDLFFDAMRYVKDSPMLGMRKEDLIED